MALKCIGWAFAGLGFLWFLVSFFSTLESAHSYFKRRRQIVKVFGAVVLSSWTPAIIVLIGSALIYYVYFGIPAWLQKDTSLRVNVHTLTYRREHSDLFAEIEFDNRGDVRRTVLAITMQYRDLSETNGNVHFLSGSEDDIWGNGEPIYVEPRKPITRRLVQPLTDKSIINVPNRIFGLVIITANLNGSRNLTVIEPTFTMKAHGSQAVAIEGHSMSHLSLDAPGGRFTADEFVSQMKQLDGSVATVLNHPEKKSLSKIKSTGRPWFAAIIVCSLFAILGIVWGISAISKRNKLKAYQQESPAKENKSHSKPEVPPIVKAIGPGEILTLADNVVISAQDRTLINAEGIQTIEAHRNIIGLSEAVPTVHASVSRLREIIKEGEALAERIKLNESIPIDRWLNKIAEVVASCARSTEIDRFERSALYFDDAGERIGWMMKLSDDNFKKLSNVLAKIKTVREIIGRLQAGES